ncbi:hypothetical protein GUJ93_ZPchr0012g21565 [Zizania palustris]|uniref:Uncharacterized protein n=1 Tax=Zizania palustris TaxID=103762 RepID=A0A8J5WTH7_ZIZPA|nr:hypothetical protein GUJ93_ZPchr0012g21565 [Zizania palustris]
MPSAGDLSTMDQFPPQAIIVVKVLPDVRAVGGRRHNRRLATSGCCVDIDEYGVRLIIFGIGWTPYCFAWTADCSGDGVLEPIFYIPAARSVTWLPGSEPPATRSVLPSSLDPCCLSVATTVVAASGLRRRMICVGFVLPESVRENGGKGRDMEKMMHREEAGGVEKVEEEKCAHACERD